MAMGPRALAASSGLAPWSMTVDATPVVKMIEDGGRGCSPGLLHGGEGVTLIMKE
ncbi:MAG TPA: hypothetical protein VLL74_05240 [Methanoregula sp.]|nr:hypothetical protein [Methanoregula sp.]